LGLHCYAVSTHPDELVLEPPLKILDPPMLLKIISGTKNSSEGVFSGGGTVDFPGVAKKNFPGGLNVVKFKFTH